MFGRFSSTFEAESDGMVIRDGGRDAGSDERLRSGGRGE
jgi:hypothetical protein